MEIPKLLRDRFAVLSQLPAKGVKLMQGVSDRTLRIVRGDRFLTKPPEAKISDISPPLEEQLATKEEEEKRFDTAQISSRLGQFSQRIQKQIQHFSLESLDPKRLSLGILSFIKPKNVVLTSKESIETPAITPTTLEKIDRQLEQGKIDKIKEIFNKLVRQVKPEDVETIDQNLDRMNRGPIKEIWSKVQVLAEMIKDPKAAWKSKAMAIAALIYLISPLDAIPDIIPIAGLADDVALIIVVVSVLADEVENYLVRQAEKKAEIEIQKYNRIVRITLIGSIIAAILTIIVQYVLQHLNN